MRAGGTSILELLQRQKARKKGLLLKWSYKLWSWHQKQGKSELLELRMERKSRRILNNKNRQESQLPSLQVGNIRLNTDFSDFFPQFMSWISLLTFSWGRPNETLDTLRILYLPTANTGNYAMNFGCFLIVLTSFEEGILLWEYMYSYP